MPTPRVAASPSKEERESAQNAAKVVAEHAKRAAEQGSKDEKKRLEEEKKQAEVQRKQDEVAAREAAVQARKDGERARLAAKELERTRKEQQAEAARIKEITDKLAKEKASRDAELEKLVTQYQKLTEGQPTSAR